MHRTIRPIVGLVVLSAVLAACSSGGSATAPPTASPDPSGSPSASPEPSDGEPGGNGAEPGQPGIGQGVLIEPQPGQQNVQSIPIEMFEAVVDGRIVTITIQWSSGVAPCSVLDQVLVNVGTGTVAITIREGTSDPDAMCVLMLESRRTIVTVDLEPGTWTITDTEGGAPPIDVTVE